MTAPAVHWTQRPENKEKLERMRKKGAQTLKARRKKNARKYSEKKPPKTHAGAYERKLEAQIIYAFAHVEEWLQVYADCIELPRSIIAERVGELLLIQARRKRVGPFNTMPEV